MSTPRSIQEKTFATHDKVHLFYRFSPAETAAPQGAIVLFHRGHEHSGRMAHLIDELGLPHHAFFAWDARGNGRSPGARGYSPSLATSVRDVQSFIDHIGNEFAIPMENIAVVAQSVGAVLVSTWVHDYAPKIRCMVLASPAFKVKLYVPFAHSALKLQYALRGNFYVNSYVKSRFLTHDPERIASYDTDPLIARPISVNMLLGLYEAGERVVADAEAIQVPTQLLISGADWVVHHGPQHEFYNRLGAADKERHILPGFYHDTFGEQERVLAVDKTRAFIERQFSCAVQRGSLLDAHRQGFTRRESDELATPLPAFSVRGAYWALSRWLLKVAGCLSDGVRLGHQTGFDSGSTLDYVYRNKPCGVTGLGRLLDRQYLNAVGWRGIRQRKLHLEELLREALGRVAKAGLPVHVLDIAAGHGRYVLDAVAGTSALPDSILLRDYSDINVRRGLALIKNKGLDSIARFEKGDAFDRDSLTGVEPHPTVGIVSGLYELFPDNDLVRRSLAGLAAAIAPGGYLVYTGQPWHPQLEYIARALTSHRQGAAWIMRRRTQAEMDQLVEAAGFRKIEQRIDEWGIFTVSLAQRRA